MELPARLCGAKRCLYLMAFSAAAASAQVDTLPAEIRIPGERVVPESLTSDRDGVIYIGSVAAGILFRASAGAATAEPWVAAGTGGMQNIYGVFADDASRTLWACSNGNPATPGGPVPPPATLHAFDLKSGAPKGKHPLPTPNGMCNDIAVASNGTVFVTDTANMQIVRLKRGAASLEVWSAEGAFGPKGGVLDGISVLKDVVYVNTLATSKLFSVAIAADGKAGEVAEVKLDRALERPDGMRSFGNSKLLVVESAAPGRLSRIDLADGAGKVTTLKESYPDNAVAVTVVGETAYVVEAQWKARRADPTYKPNPFHATATHVGRP